MILTFARRSGPPSRSWQPSLTITGTGRLQFNMAAMKLLKQANVKDVVILYNEQEPTYRWWVMRPVTQAEKEHGVDGEPAWWHTLRYYQHWCGFTDKAWLREKVHYDYRIKGLRKYQLIWDAQTRAMNIKIGSKSRLEETS